MKKVILTAAAIAITFIGCGQRSVDNLFRKYSGNDGYVTITINGNLLSLARLLDDDNDSSDHQKWPSEITEIRILAREKENTSNENFYDMVKREINNDHYEEFMRVKEKDQDLVMLVRAEGRNFKEFLLVAGGDDNVIIQIRGNLSMKDARKISADFKNDHDMDLVSERN